MNIKTIIIIILSLYGIGSTIAFIYYLIKYNNIKSEIESINNSNLNNKECKNSNDNQNKINDSSKIDNNLNESIQNTTLMPNFDEKYLKLIQTYDIYNDADFYDKYDLYDEYNDKIIIYSRDLKNCYLSCESLNDCFAFTKYNNFCYLKGKYDLSQKNNATKSLLIVKKNVEFNQTLPLLNNTNLLLNDTNLLLNETILFPNETIIDNNNNNNNNNLRTNFE